MDSEAVSDNLMNTTVSSVKHFLLRALAFTVCLSCNLQAQELNELPSVKLLSAPLVIPSDAWAYYGTNSNHTPGVGAWTPANRPPEIQELARALGAGRYPALTYAANVHEYIRNNISDDFRFGLSKGARGVIVDQSGTAFDQAHLMVELLRQGNQTANYQVGTITLSAAQFTSWTGFTDAKAACQFLADGGIPATVNGLGSCATQTGPVSSVVMGHIWVSANGRFYDPAYKPKVAIAAVADLAQAMGCGTAAAPTCGNTILSLMPGLSTDANGMHYVQGSLTSANAVQSQMTTFATALQHWIQNYNATNKTSVRVEDLLGSRMIDQSAASCIWTGTTSPCYGAITTQYTWTADIPNPFRTTLRVQFDQINQTFYVDEIFGKRLRAVTAPYNGPPSPPNPANRIYALYLDFQPVAKSSITNGLDTNDDLILEVNHPYSANGGSYADEQMTQTTAAQVNGHAFSTFCNPCNWFFSSFTILHGWGDAYESEPVHFGALQSRDLQNTLPVDPSNANHLWLQNLGGTCVPTSVPTTVVRDPGCFEQHQQIAAAYWMSESARLARLVASMSKGAVQHHHSLGYVLSGPLEGQGVSPSTNISIGSALSFRAFDGNAPNRQSAFEAITAGFDRMEGSVFEQYFGAWEGGSAVSWMGRSFGLGMKFLEVNNGNVAYAITQLSNYSTTVTGRLQGYTTAGYTAIVPQNGNPFFKYSDGSTYTSFFNGYVGFTAAGDRLAYINGTEKGGEPPGIDFDPSVTAASVVQETNYTLKARGNGSVQLTDGSLQIEPIPDLTVGTGKFPYSLEFQRYYSQDTIGNYCNVPETTVGDNVNGIGNINGDVCLYSAYSPTDPFAPLGGGWTHSFAYSATTPSDGSVGLGRDSALDAAAVIAGLYISQNLTATSSTVSRVATSLTTLWWGSQLQFNTVRIKRGPAIDTFARLPDGTSFNPRPGSTEKLRQTAGSISLTGVLGFTWMWDFHSLTFDLVERDGSDITWDYGVSSQLAPTTSLFKPEAWTFPSGVVVSFSYGFTIDQNNPIRGQYCLSGVSNNLGRQLTFDTQCPVFGNIDSIGPAWDAGHPIPKMGLSTVSDPENSRSVSFRAVLSPGYADYYQTDSVSNFASIFPPQQFLVTLPDNSVTRYDYTSIPTTAVNRSYLALSRWFTPTDLQAGVPDATVSFDTLMRVSGISDSYPHTVSYYIAGIYGTEAQKRADTDDPQTVPPAAPQVATTTQYFDLFNKHLATIDPLGRATYYSYDSARRLVTETAPEGNSTSYSYDARSNLLTTTRHAKPGSGFADITSSVTYEEGPTVASCSSPFTCNKEAATKDSLGRTTSYFYRSNGQLQRVVKPAVTAQAGGYAGSPQKDYCYAPQPGTSGSISMVTGTIELVKAGTNRVHSYSYDSAANHVVPLTETTDPSPTLVPPPSAGGDCTSSQTSTALGLVSHIAFDRVGNVSGITDPRNNTTNYAHDAMRRLTAVNAPLNQLTRRCYNADGLEVSENRARTAVSDPNAGTETTTGQCSAAFPVASWESDTKQYFTTGDLQSVTDSSGFVTSYAYDPDGRTQVVEDGDGRDTAMVFDLAGQMVGKWRGGTGWIDIGGTGEASSTVPVSSTPWVAASYPGFGPLLYGQYSYNANGTRHSETDADGGVTTFGYDGFDRMTSIGYPDGKSESLWYTLDGTSATSRCSDSDQPCRKILRSGQYVSFHYNELDHEDQRTPQAEGAYTLGQNLLSELTQVSKSGAGSAPAHTTLFDYDGAGRRAYEMNDSRRMSFGYDASGNRNQLTWPDNYSVSYQYDALNRMSYAVENGVTELAYFHYNPLSQRDYACFGGQSVACQQAGGGGTNKTTFGYDSNGDLSSIGYVLNGTTVTLGYGHNRSHQINSMNASDGFYLPAVEQGPTAYTPAPLNQYGAIGGTQTHYDNNGNLLTLFPADGAQTFTYDSENRLINAAVGGSPTASIFYDYDALERRVAKTVGGSALGVGGTTTIFLLDGQEEVAELDGAGNVLRRYIPGPTVDERIVAAEGSSTTAPVRTYFHVDYAGTVRAMSDASGNVTGCAQGVLCQQLGYDDFGNLSSGTGATGEPYRFTGQRYDAETGMYYYRARYYSPSIGRFMQMDPVGSKDDLNLYAYVFNDPMGKTDPMGLGAWEDFRKGMIEGAAWSIYNTKPPNASGWENFGQIVGAVGAGASRQQLGGLTPVAREATALNAAVEHAPPLPPRGALQQAAAAVRTAANHPAAANQRTIAVGQRVNGEQVVSSSNRLDAGMRAKADELGLTIVPSVKGNHAEENLMQAHDDLVSIGTSVRQPCGASEHDCAGQMEARGIENNNLP